MRAHRNIIFNILRWLWFACGVFFWTYWFASLPRFIEWAASGTLPAALIDGIAPAQVAADGAAAWGTSVGTWAWINLLTNGLAFLVFSIVGLLIWRQVCTGFGLLTAYVLLLTGSNFMNNAIYSAELSATALSIWELGAIVWPIFLLWLFLFPNGRAVPRRLLWLFAPLLTLFGLLFGFYLITSFFKITPEISQLLLSLQPIYDGLIPILFLLVIGAQIYRYSKVSSLVEKKQMRWFLFGIVVAILIPLVLDLFIQYPAEIGTLAFTAIPLGIGISILRYRLWDIDLVIRKTLQYALLTGLLALVYFGSVVLLQTLVEKLIGEQSQLVIVFSTLIIAVLFNPLRLRVQDFIDRRFFRKKYDAEQTLERFTVAARDEVELDILIVKLVNVIEETLQPEKINLWLKK